MRIESLKLIITILYNIMNQSPATSFHSFKILLASLTLQILISITTCNNPVLRTLDCIPVVVEGYDVVYYFQSNNSKCETRSGNPSYYYNLESSDQNGDMRTYQFWFSSQENLDLFSSNPWYYAPKYGGFCSFGTCCELNKMGWPWNASHLGPPAGPDTDKCGFRVHNNSLYFNIWDSYDAEFFKPQFVHDRINAADTRWISWFGNLHSGVFNFNCFSTYMQFGHCVDNGQAFAPLASDVELYGYGVCSNKSEYYATTGWTGRDDSSSGDGGSSSSENEQGLDGEDGVIVGTVSGAVFLIIVIGVIVVCVKCGWWKKSKIGRSVENKLKAKKVGNSNKNKFVKLKEDKTAIVESDENDGDELAVNDGDSPTTLENV